MGNRLSYVKKTQTTKRPDKTDVAESAFYKYNDSNQLVSAELFDGKKTTVTYTYDGNGNSGNNGNGNKKENSKSKGTDDAGYGNATNAEEHNSQNQSGILFPIAEEASRTESNAYVQVRMELNINGAMDAAYTYGVSRLMEDRSTGESNFYLYDPAGNVAGITDQDGYLWQSYRYDAFGNATFGCPQYDNEYTFNGESYNPNIHSQYLRARYYDTVKGSFLTEDSYLGDIRNPLTQMN